MVDSDSLIFTDKQSGQLLGSVLSKKKHKKKEERKGQDRAQKLLALFIGVMHLVFIHSFCACGCGCDLVLSA